MTTTTSKHQVAFRLSFPILPFRQIETRSQNSSHRHTGPHERISESALYLRCTSFRRFCGFSLFWFFVESVGYAVSISRLPRPEGTLVDDQRLGGKEPNMLIGVDCHASFAANRFFREAAHTVEKKSSTRSTPSLLASWTVNGKFKTEIDQTKCCMA